MMRTGSHRDPPPREPGESYESWLEAARTAVVLLPERPSVDPRSETVKEPAVRPARVCALDGCGIVFNPRAATQQCCSRPHREALARAEGRKSQQQPAEQNRAAWRFMGQAASVPKLTTTRKPRRQPALKEPSQLVPSICLVHKQEMRNGQPIGARCRGCLKLARQRATGVRSRDTLRVTLIPCPICATPFAPVMIGKGQRKKTCSAACGRTSFQRTWQARQAAKASTRAATTPRDPLTRSCAHCQTSFQPPRARQRYCSLMCANRALTSRLRLPEIPCPICTTPFRPKSHGAQKAPRRTCSVACAAVQRGISRRTAPRIPCPRCGTEFPQIVTRDGQRRVYCSRACYLAAGAPNQRRQNGRFVA
jgi:hypothetical protein